MSALGRWIALWILAVALSAEASALEFRYASVEEGRAILLGDDEWYAALGPAEIAIRMKALAPDKTADDLKDFYRGEVLAWSEEDISLQGDVITGSRLLFTAYENLFPQTVWLVKASKRVEGAMPHTRGNAIFVPETAGHISQYVLLHELFHILSREQSSRRDTLYRLIGFKPCNLEETPWMKARRLSNPDVPPGAYYLALKEKTPGAVIPWLHAAHDAFDPEVPGGFAGHFGFGLLSVTVQEGTCKPRQSPAGVPEILSPVDVPGFHAAVGTNTGYIIHPEEVLADNFVFLLTGQKDLPNPEIVERLGNWLKQK